MLGAHRGYVVIALSLVKSAAADGVCSDTVKHDDHVAQAQWRLAFATSNKLRKTLSAQEWSDKQDIIRFTHERFAEFDRGNWVAYVNAYAEDGRFIIVADGAADVIFIDGKQAIRDVVENLHEERHNNPTLEGFYHEVLSVDFLELTPDSAEIAIHLHTWQKEIGQNWVQKDLGPLASGQYVLVTKHRKEGGKWLCTQQTTLVKPL